MATSTPAPIGPPTLTSSPIITRRRLKGDNISPSLVGCSPVTDDVLVPEDRCGMCYLYVHLFIQCNENVVLEVHT